MGGGSGVVSSLWALSRLSPSPNKEGVSVKVVVAKILAVGRTEEQAQGSCTVAFGVIMGNMTRERERDPDDFDLTIKV
jgi:hypothetical protein